MFCLGKRNDKRSHFIKKYSEFFSPVRVLRCLVEQHWNFITLCCQECYEINPIEKARDLRTNSPERKDLKEIVLAARKCASAECDWVTRCTRMTATRNEKPKMGHNMRVNHSVFPGEFAIYTRQPAMENIVLLFFRWRKIRFRVKLLTGRGIRIKYTLCITRRISFLCENNWIHSYVDLLFDYCVLWKWELVGYLMTIHYAVTCMETAHRYPLNCIFFIFTIGVFQCLFLIKQYWLYFQLCLDLWNPHLNFEQKKPEVPDSYSISNLWN